MKLVMEVLLAVIMMLFSVAQSIKFNQPNTTLWENFKSEYRRKYKNATDEEFKMENFMKNTRIIMEHNVKYELGLVSYRMKMNEYSDMHSREMNQIMNGFKIDPDVEFEGARRSLVINFIPPANVKLPASIDWRKMGAVTPVNHQHSCGSCWAFSATGSVEGQLYRREGYLVPLSAQNLLDCSKKFGSNGCSGGSPITAFQYIIENGGINSEKNYPYKGENYESCKFDPKKIEVKIVGYVNIPEGDEEKLKAAVATVGPISIAIDSRSQSFKLYSEGVYEEPNCKNDLYSLDHAALIVGYGTDENEKDYWIVKNSFGTSWGEEGYIKMIRNKGNRCGIASYAFYPIL